MLAGKITVHRYKTHKLYASENLISPRSAPDVCVYRRLLRNFLLLARPSRGLSFQKQPEAERQTRGLNAKEIRKFNAGPNSRLGLKVFLSCRVASLPEAAPGPCVGGRAGRHIVRGCLSPAAGSTPVLAPQGGGGLPQPQRLLPDGSGRLCCFSVFLASSKLVSARPDVCVCVSVDVRA